jgi:AraC family transcriptional regulator, regulatory protein of adaptative response / methylated-DNA-[protein]-cysteine methyltransferase
MVERKGIIMGKAKGTASAVHWAQVPTTLGPVVIAATEAGVGWLSFESDPRGLKAGSIGASLVEGGALVTALLNRVLAAIEAPDDAMFDIPVDPQGTPFQQAVWAELRRIPCGETRTYGDLAARLGKPGGSRAVGGANGANRIAVLIPCHRVIASDGTLGGYAWGLDVKRELLRRERAGVLI